MEKVLASPKQGVAPFFPLPQHPSQGKPSCKRGVKGLSEKVSEAEPCTGKAGVQTHLNTDMSYSPWGLEWSPRALRGLFLVLGTLRQER